MDETETKNKMEKQHNGIDRRERNGMRKKRRRKRKKNAQFGKKIDELGFSERFNEEAKLFLGSQFTVACFVQLQLSLLEILHILLLHLPLPLNTSEPNALGL